MKLKNKLAVTLLAALLIAAVFVFLQGSEDETTVYVTNSGDRYHLDGCSSLSRSKIAVTLNEAVHSGYTACGVCKPPQPPAGAAPARPVANQVSGLYRVNIAELKTTAAADSGQMLKAQVVDHVDGDTVRVRVTNPPAGIGVVETIRLIGVDTPETVHPSRPVEHFGEAASNFTKTRLLNKNVLLAFDWDLRDRYGRLLAYIYISGEDGLYCHNAALIREGYAHAYTRFAFQFAEEFRALEQEARSEQRGLWR
jgi:micrococcal nuclease